MLRDWHLRNDILFGEWLARDKDLACVVVVKLQPCHVVDVAQAAKIIRHSPASLGFPLVCKIVFCHGRLGLEERLEAQHPTAGDVVDVDMITGEASDGVERRAIALRRLRFHAFRQLFHILIYIEPKRRVAHDFVKKGNHLVDIKVLRKPDLKKCLLKLRHFILDSGQGVNVSDRFPVFRNERLVDVKGVEILAHPVVNDSNTYRHGVVLTDLGPDVIRECCCHVFEGLI